MEPQHTPASRPIKLVIADDLRVAIENGDLKPGDSLPTLHALIEKYECSMTSAREALGLLKEQGLVSGGRGRPLRVRAKGVPTIRSSERHQIEKDRVLLSLEERQKVGTSELENKKSITDLQFTATYDRMPATRELSRAFEIQEDEELLTRIFELKEPKTGIRTAWSISYIPVELVASNPDLLDSKKEPWPGGTMHQLSTVGVEVTKVIDEVTSRMSTTVERQLWGLETGIPMILIRRISYDVNEKIVEISDAQYPADRTKLEFVTELKRWEHEN